MRAGHRLATPEIAMQETAEEGDLHSLLLEATPEQETPGLHLEATLEVEIPGPHLEATPPQETPGLHLEATPEPVATADQVSVELTQASVGRTLEVAMEAGQPLAEAMATLAATGLALEPATIGQDLVDPTPALTTEDLLLVAILPDPATLEGQELVAIQERVKAMELDATADNSVATTTAEGLDLEGIPEEGPLVSEGILEEGPPVSEAIPEEGPPDSEDLAMVHQGEGRATTEPEQAGTDVSSAGSRARFLRDPAATVPSPQSAHRSSTVPPYSRSSRAPTTTSSAPEVTGASMTPLVPRSVRGLASSGTRRNATSSTSATTTSGSRSTPSMSSLVPLSWGTTVTSLPATGPSKDPLLNALNNIQPLAVTPIIPY